MTNNQLTAPVSDEELDQMIWKLERDGMTPKMLSLMREVREVRRAKGEPVAWEVNGVFCHTLEEASNYVGTPDPLYAAPQLPQLAPEEIAMQNFRDAMEGIGHIRSTLEETFGGLHGTHCEPDVLVECKEICDAIYEAYRKTAQVTPDGWQLVPIDPTKDMLRAGQSVVGFWLNTVHCYSKMLAAAPEAPQREVK